MSARGGIISCKRAWEGWRPTLEGQNSFPFQQTLNSSLFIWRKMQALKQGNPELKTQISIGGWWVLRSCGGGGGMQRNAACKRGAHA